FATTGALSFGDLAEIWGPWPVAFLGRGLLIGMAMPSGQSLCTPLTHRVAFIRWFACSFPFSATPSRYSVTRDWVGAVGCTCDVSHGFTPQDYSRRMHKMGSGPEGWPGRIDYRRSSMATSRRIFRGVVLGIQSQLRLAGIDPGGFSQVDNHLHLVEAARLGEQAASELQPSQRRLTWLRDGQRRIAHVSRDRKCGRQRRSRDWSAVGTRGR